MNTYLKMIVVATLFLTSSVALGAELTNQSQPDQAKQETNVTAAQKDKESSVAKTEHTSKTNESTEKSSESAQAVESDSSEPTSQGTNEATVESSSKEMNEASQPTQENVEPAVNVNAAEPENSTSTVVETQNEANPAPTQIQANQLGINGQFIPYMNAGQGNGQAIIDANANMVATWGGTTVQSGNDGTNTHFIGHNPGIFNVLFSLNAGDRIEASDSANQVTSYTVSQIVTVDDSGMAADGTDYWDQITGTGGGERITLQTCINDDYNLIVFANK